MEDVISSVRAVLYENGKTPKKERVFPDRDALTRFLGEQSEVMAHAGWTIERGEDWMHLYPPPDSMSDGTWLTWTAVEG